MFQCTGTTSWATYVWDYVFAPGVLPAGTNVGESSGVGWDGTISTTPSSSASGSIWATSLASNSTTSNDPRIYEGRILFLTGALAGQHVQVIGYDGAGNVTIGTPTVALTGTPSAGDSFQLVPYPFHPTNSSDTVDNYHQQAGFILDIAMLLWPWFSATQIRQVTNMFNWWADCHIGVDQAGTPNTWDVITYSHDDCMVGTATTLVIDQCVPDNPLKGRWLNQAYYGAQIPPMVTTGTMDPGGATSTTFGYSDKSSYRNTVLHWALCGRGGRYIIGDKYDTGDAREALCSMEIAADASSAPTTGPSGDDSGSTSSSGSCTPHARQGITPLVGDDQYLNVGISLRPLPDLRELHLPLQADRRRRSGTSQRPYLYRLG